MPLLLVYLAFTIVAGWAAIELVTPGLPWWVVALVLTATFLAVRVGAAVLDLLARGGRRAEGPLERLLAQFVARAADARAEPEVHAIAHDVVALATGIDVRIVAEPASSGRAWPASQLAAYLVAEREPERSATSICTRRRRCASRCTRSSRPTAPPRWCRWPPPAS
ncbi:MAG: hypothetical protein R2939_09220 [Kofleriaceae bacterium]